MLRTILATEEAEMLKPGDTVPDVALMSADDAPVQLQAYLGKPLIVQCLRYYG
jgi:peroxiredoxin